MADFDVGPGDPELPDPGPDADDPEPAPSSLFDSGDEAVEVYAAGNIVEAHELCEVLDEQGIEGRVVGDFLGGAAGSLPLGEPTLPRVWVRQRDAARAREIIGEATAQARQAATELAGSGERDDETEVKPSAEVEEEAPLPSGAWFSLMSAVFAVLGLACILVGGRWAWNNWAMLRAYPATTEGVLSDYGISGFKSQRPSPPEDTPVPQVRAQVRVLWDVTYTYTVSGREYRAVAHDSDEAYHHTVIHYDPERPENHFVGPVMPPWLTLLFALAIGGFLWFVGYQFR